MSAMDKAMSDIVQSNKEVRMALQDMVAAFGGGGITEPLSVRIAAMQRACRVLGLPERMVEVYTGEEA